MKYYLPVFVLFFTVQMLFAQTPPNKNVQLNSSVMYKDTAGVNITFSEFLKQTSARDSKFEPQFDEQGNVKEVLIIKSSIDRNQYPLFDSKPKVVATPPPAPSYPTTTTNVPHSDVPLTAGVSTSNYIPSSNSLIPGSPIPYFSGQDLYGQYYDNGNLYGKVVVLKFWFIGCPPCIKEFPHVNNLVEKYRGKNVLFLAPALDDQADLQSFLASRPLLYQVIPNAESIMEQFRVKGYPTHVVINPDGKIQKVFSGKNSKIEVVLSRAIDEALYQESPAREILEEDLITLEDGSIVPFHQSLNMVSSGQYTPWRRKDGSGRDIIVLKKRK